MEQVKERAKVLRIIAGVAVIICAIYGAINYTLYLNAVGVFSQSATGGSYFNFTFMNVINVFLVPYVFDILEIVLGVLLLTKNLKGILIIAIVKFAFAYLDIIQNVYNYFYYMNMDNTQRISVVNIIVSLLFSGGLLCLSLVAFLRQKTNNKAAFVLSIIFFVITVYGYFTNCLNAIGGYPGSNALLTTFSLVANVLLAVYLAFGVREKPAKKALAYQSQTAQQVGEGTQQTQQFSVGAQPQAFTAEDYGYQDIVKFAVLCFVTFGIWYYIWIYKTVKNLELGGKSKDAGLELVLVMFIPFYYIYWLYKASKSLDEQLKAYGNTADDVIVITLILSICVGSTIGGIFLQYKINELAKLKQAATTSANSFNNANGGGTKNF